MEIKKIIIVSVITIISIGVLLTAILVPLGIDYIFPGEFGLLYNTKNKNIESNTYTNGRYFIGLSNKFIRFPSNLFSIECITKNYQTINLELQINLQLNIKDPSLNKTALFDFYSKYGSNWIQIIKQSIIHNIIDISANYNLFDFFEIRFDFKNSLTKAINDYLNLNTLNVIKLNSLNLLNIKFSQEILKAIERKLIEKQNTRATQIEGSINYINKQTEGLTRIANKEIDSIYQTQLSNFENTKINVHFRCLDTVIRADADAYSDLNTSLNLSFDNNLINFIYSFERKRFSGQQVVNFPSFSLDSKNNGN